MPEELAQALEIIREFGSRIALEQMNEFAEWLRAIEKKMGAGEPGRGLGLARRVGAQEMVARRQAQENIIEPGAKNNLVAMVGLVVPGREIKNAVPQVGAKQGPQVLLPATVVKGQGQGDEEPAVGAGRQFLKRVENIIEQAVAGGQPRPCLRLD